MTRLYSVPNTGALARHHRSARSSPTLRLVQGTGGRYRSAAAHPGRKPAAGPGRWISVGVGISAVLASAAVAVGGYGGTAHLLGPGVGQLGDGPAPWSRSRPLSDESLASIRPV